MSIVWMEGEIMDGLVMAILEEFDKLNNKKIKYNIRIIL